MNTFIFTNGDVVTTKLNQTEMMKRMKRIDLLRVLTEQYDCDEGISISTKARRAYNKLNGFTGIVHLSNYEKEWLSYMLESDTLDEDSIECIKFYSGAKQLINIDDIYYQSLGYWMERRND